MMSSEVCIQWTLYYPMRPRERICEWQWSDATDAGRSRDSNNMADAVCQNLNHTTQYTHSLGHRYVKLNSVHGLLVCFH